jgi:proline iminopeptidase
MELEAAKEYENMRYKELLLENYYTEHVLRWPLEKWPRMGQTNGRIYVLM